MGFYNIVDLLATYVYGFLRLLDRFVVAAYYCTCASLYIVVRTPGAPPTTHNRHPQAAAHQQPVPSSSVLEKCSIDSKVFIFFEVNKLIS